MRTAWPVLMRAHYAHPPQGTQTVCAGKALLTSTTKSLDMKKLYLLRHAKSSWEALDMADHERPLAARGERAALVMGRYIEQRRLLPDLVLCSTAVRSIETLRLTATQWSGTPKTEFDRSLYLTGQRAILERIAAVDRSVTAVMVIAHNPDLQDLTVRLIGGEDVPMRQLAERKFPTAALAVFHLAIERWSDIRSATGTMVELETPKTLV